MCSVHRGKFGTLGGVQYIGGCSVNWEVFSTSGGYHDYIGGYHEYIGGGGGGGGVQYIRGISWCIWGISEYMEGCSVHRGDIMSTLGDVQYIGEIS